MPASTPGAVSGNANSSPAVVLAQSDPVETKSPRTVPRSSPATDPAAAMVRGVGSTSRLSLLIARVTRVPSVPL